MCCCSAGINIMKHALSLFPHTLCPSFSFPPLFFSSLFPFVPAFIHFQTPRHYSPPPPLQTVMSFVLTISHYPFLSLIMFFSPVVLPSRGAGVIGALSLLGQRAAGSGQGALRAGFRPGGRPPICPSLRPSPRTHPAPAPPSRAGPGDTKVCKPNTPLSPASAPPSQNKTVMICVAD